MKTKKLARLLNELLGSDFGRALSQNCSSAGDEYNTGRQIASIVVRGVQTNVPPNVIGMVGKYIKKKMGARYAAGYWFGIAVAMR